MAWFIASTIISFLYFTIRFAPAAVNRLRSDQGLVSDIRLWTVVFLGFISFIILMKSMDGSLTDRTTWILAQALAGFVVGAVLAFLWQVFSRLLQGEPPPTIGFYYHVWIAAALVLLLLIGVLGPNMAVVFSRISNLNVGSVSVQISTQVKNDRADLSKYADPKSPSFSYASRYARNTGMLSFVIERDIEETTTMHKYFPNSWEQDESEIKAHKLAKEAIATLFGPISECLDLSTTSSLIVYPGVVDQELIRSRTREVTAVFHSMLVARSSDITDYLIKKWVDRINAAINLMETDIESTTTYPRGACTPIKFEDIRQLLAEASQPGVTDGIGVLAREPTFILAISYLDTFNGNFDTARHLLNERRDVIYKSGRENYDYFLAGLDQDTTGSAIDYLATSKRLAEEGKELGESISDIRAGSAEIDYDPSDAMKLKALELRAKSAQLNGMNLYVYGVGQAIALDDEMPSDAIGRAENFAALLKHQLDAADAKTFLKSNPGFTSAAEDTLGFFGLVQEAQNESPDMDAVKAATRQLCDASADLPGETQQTVGSASGWNETAKRHMALAKLVLHSSDPCSDVRNVRWRDRDLHWW